MAPRNAQPGCSPRGAMRSRGRVPACASAATSSAPNSSSVCPLQQWPPSYAPPGHGLPIAQRPHDDPAPVAAARRALSDRICIASSRSLVARSARSRRFNATSSAARDRAWRANRRAIGTNTDRHYHATRGAPGWRGQTLAPSPHCMSARGDGVMPALGVSHPRATRPGSGHGQSPRSRPGEPGRVRFTWRPSLPAGGLACSPAGTPKGR